MQHVVLRAGSLALAAMLGVVGCGSVGVHHDAGDASGGTTGQDAGGGAMGQDSGGDATGQDAGGGAPGQDAASSGTGGTSGGQGGAAGTTSDGGMDQTAAADGPLTPPATTAVSLDDITTFAAASGIFTKVPYIKELYDDRNEFDTATNRFTATDAGDYLVCASLTSNPDTHGFELDLYVNGVRENALSGAAGSGFEQGCRVVRLPAGAYVEIWVLQSSGAAVTFAPNTYWNWMTVSKVASTVSLDDISAFSAASGTFTKVPYGTKLYDDQNQFDAATSRFTAAAAGDYQVCASLTLTPSPPRAFEIDLYVNGARDNAFAGGAGGGGFEHGCRVVRLAAGNYLEVWVYQSSGAPVTFAPNTFWNWMTVTRLPASLSLDNAPAFTATSGTFARVPYGTVLYDDKNQFNATNARFTAAESGDYQLCSSLTSNPDLAHGFELDLYINGARENAFAGGLGGNGFEHGCRVVRLVAGNYLEVWVYQASGAPTAFAPDTYWNWLTVAKVR